MTTNSTHHSVFYPQKRTMAMTSLDPKQLQQITNCPACDTWDTFRPQGVMGQYWMKRCARCGYSKDWPLPKIIKKIIYLDQFVISNMVKCKQPFWTELRTRLASLASLQLIACPYSEIHQDESLLSHSLRESLKGMYRSFGGNNQFRHTGRIEQTQLLRSISSWLDVSHSDKARPLWRDAFDHDPHSWTGDFQVFADFPVHEPWVTDLRNRKQELHADLKSVCEYWKNHPATFDEDVAEEVRGYARPSIELYRSLAPAKFNRKVPPSIQPGVMLIHCLADEIKNARPDEADPVQIVEEFFNSQAARYTPFLAISASLWAKIAQAVRNPKCSRVPDDGDSFDIKAISTYAPYCDAMFVEKEFEELWRQLKLNERFAVRLFSVQSTDEFQAYLDDLLKNISDAHRAGLALLYPHLAPALAALDGK